MPRSNKSIKMTEEQSKFAEDNHRLIYQYIHENELYPVEDWTGICSLGYCRAVISYDESKGAFSSYAHLAMKSAVWRHKRDSYKRNEFDWQMIRLDDQMNRDEDDLEIGEISGTIDKNVESIAFISDLREVYDELPSRVKNVVELKYLGLSQQQIADRLGTTQMTVSRDLKKFAERLCA